MADDKDEDDEKRAAAEAYSFRAARSRDERRYYFKFLVAGNAGGLVAALGLIGTLLGSSNGGKGPIPIIVFGVLLLFLAGFVITILAQALNASSAGDASYLSAMKAYFDIDLPGRRFPSWKYRAVPWLEGIAAFTFLAASSGGVWQLWKLTDCAENLADGVACF